jgi:hypothetical protein
MGLQDDLSFRWHQGVLGKMDRKPGCWTSTEEAAGGEFESFTAKIFGDFGVQLLQVTKQGTN